MKLYIIVSDNDSILSIEHILVDETLIDEYEINNGNFPFRVITYIVGGDYVDLVYLISAFKDNSRHAILSLSPSIEEAFDMMNSWEDEDSDYKLRIETFRVSRDVN